MPVTFQVLGGTLDLQADFERPVFQMLGSPAALHDRLWTHLSSFGLRPTDLWFNQGLGLGGASLNCAVRAFGIDFKVYVNRAELSCPEITRTPSQELADITLAAFDSLRNDTEGPRFRTYSLAVGLHGTLEGLTPQAFLSQYTVAPQGESLTALLGSGAIFYYGGSADQLSGSLSVDLSGWSDKAVFIRSYSVWDAATTPLDGLPETGRRQLKRATMQLGLDVVGLQLQGD